MRGRAVNARTEDGVLAAPAGLQLRIRLVRLTARAVRADIAVRVADAPISAERAALCDGTRPGGDGLTFERFRRVIRGHLRRQCAENVVFQRQQTDFLRIGEVDPKC